MTNTRPDEITARSFRSEMRPCTCPHGGVKRLPLCEAISSLQSDCLSVKRLPPAVFCRACCHLSARKMIRYHYHHRFLNLLLFRMDEYERLSYCFHSLNTFHKNQGHIHRYSKSPRRWSTILLSKVNIPLCN